MSTAKQTSEKRVEGPLSQAQVQEFFDLGYTVVRDLFSENEIEKMRSCFERLQNKALKLKEPTMIDGSLFVVEKQGAIDRIVWCGAAEPHLLDVGADPRLLQPSAQLLQSTEMDQLINQAHFKLPQDGVSFIWHQDSEHRRFGTEVWKDVNGKGSFIQTILAIDEMRRDNGPLMLIPRSSKWGHLDLNKRSFKIEFTPQDGIEYLTMKPGTVLFMGPYTIHASFPNQSKKPRRVLINGYSYPGANTRQYPGDGAGRRLIVK